MSLFATVRNALLNQNVTDLIVNNENNSVDLARSIGGDGYEYYVKMVTTNTGVLLAGTTFKSVSETTDFLLAKMTLDGKIIKSNINPKRLPYRFNYCCK